MSRREQIITSTDATVQLWASEEKALQLVLPETRDTARLCCFE